MREGALRGKADKSGGFTLIEILLVTVIIAVMLAVIIPRAFRAQTDAKYNIVRQTAAELGRWGMTWAERNLDAQEESDTCRLNNYVYSLRGYIGAQNNTNNWTSSVTPTGDAAWDQGPSPNCLGTAPAMTVEGIMPEDKKPKNPFNGVSYFLSANSGGTVNPGVLALVSVSEGVNPTYQNYYFVYLGTDSTTTTHWTAGMGTSTSTLTNLTLSQARNGVFMARLAQN